MSANEAAKSTDKIHVLIVDDHPVVRMGLRAALECSPELEVIGDVADIPEMLKLLREKHPDVVVLDLALDDTPVMEPLRSLRKHHPETKVIVYSAHEDEELISEAMELVAQGYLPKCSDPSVLLNAIQVVHQGGTILDPAIATKLVHSIHTEKSNGKSDASFTNRELEVLRLLALGKSNHQIATLLFISERTVKFHVSSILGKLNAQNRTEAVLLATKMGILKE